MILFYRKRLRGSMEKSKRKKSGTGLAKKALRHCGPAALPAPTTLATDWNIILKFPNKLYESSRLNPFLTSPSPTGISFP